MKYVRWVLILALLIGYLVVEIAVFKPFAGPPPLVGPEATTPDDAVYAVELYKPSLLFNHRLDTHDEEKGLFKYRWELKADADPRQVLEFYARQLPDATVTDKGRKRSFEYQPEGAFEPEELTTVGVKAHRGGTLIEVDQIVKITRPRESHLGAWAFRLVTLVVLIVLFLSKKFFTRMGAEAVRRKVGEEETEYQLLQDLPTDVLANPTWSQTAQALQKEGFFPIGDFSYSRGSGPIHYLRAFQEPTRTLTASVHVRGDSVYVEILTFFENAGTVTTSTLPHPDAAILPPDLMLEQMAEGTPIPQLLARHKLVKVQMDSPIVPTRPELFPRLWRMIEMEPYARVQRKAGSKSALKPLADRCVGYIPEPPAEEAEPGGPPVQDEAESFVQEMVDRIQHQHGDWELKRKNRFEQVLKRPGYDACEIDLEALSYLIQRPEIDREQAIERYLEKLEDLE